MKKCANPECKNLVNNNVKNIFKQSYCAECAEKIKQSRSEI